MSALAVAASLILATGGCSTQPRVLAESQPSPSSPSLPSSARSDASAAPAQNDLRSGSVEKVFKSGELTVNATYSTPLPTREWTAGTTKPLVVSLSAIDNDHDVKKIYLSKTVVSAAALGNTGPLGEPVAISDTAKINPGYVINFPYTYEQQFSLPTVDKAATSLAVTFSYELVSLVATNPKDYTKQTATSTIKVPLS